MDQVTTTLMQAAVADDVYDASLQSVRYRLTAASHNEICYSDSLDTWVAACNNGTIGVSRNSVDWYYFYLGTTNNLNSVAFANGLFVAVGSNSSVYTSTNGYDWIQRTFPVSSLTLTEVVYGNALWVVSCNTSSQRIFSSVDGITWSGVWNTGGSIFVDKYTSTYYANGIWVTILGGQPATSADGITWTSRPVDLNHTFSFLLYTGSVWITSTAGINSRVSISTDGLNWTPTFSLIFSAFLPPATFGINGSNIILGSVAPSVYVSLDNGANWEYVSMSGSYTGSVQGLAYGNSRWVAVTQNQAAISTTNGLTWTQTVASGLGQSVSGLLYANSLFVFGSSTGVIKTSPDGTTWTTRTSNTTQPIYDIKYFNNLFISVGGSGNIRNGGSDTTGPTGTGWTTITSGTTNQLNKVSFGLVNGTTPTWVAVGNNGTIVSSTDNAVNWTVRTTGITTSLNNVEFKNNIWVVYGASNVILTSSDGVTWTVQKRDLQQPRSFDYGNGVWTGVGISGEIVTSPDLLNWTFRTSNTTSQLNRVVYRNNTWVTVGTGGAIRTSENAITWTSRTSNTSATFNDVEYSSVANLWAAVGVSGLYRTAPATNLSSWTGSATIPSSTLTGLAYSAARNKFIAVSTAGSIYNIALNNQSIQSAYIINNGDNQFGINPINNGLYSAAAGTFSTDTFNTYLMACGNGGIIKYLRTPTNTNELPVAWRSTSSGTTNALQKIVYGNGIFVAVGVSGTIVSSTAGNLLSFTVRTSGTTQTLNDVAYGLVNGTTPTWVAVGNNGTILRSTDGTTWAAASNTGGLSTNVANCVTFANNQFVVGNAGNIANIRYSSDGNTWTAATGTTNNNSVLDIVYGASTFIATTAAFAYTSSNGTVWTAAATGTELQKLVVQNAGYYITFLNNKFIAFPNSQQNVIYISKNGTNWSQVPVPFVIPTATRDSIAYYEGKYVIVAGRNASIGYVGYSTI
jgi:hypothetical protein